MNNLDISFRKETYESDFYHNLLQEEFKNIIYNNDIINKRLHIFSSYSYENEYEIEFGVYIINSSLDNIVIKNLPFCLYNNETKIYNQQVFINKTIESNSAIFIEIKIKKEDIKEEYKLEDISISIDEINSIKKFPHINVNMDDIPRSEDYTNYRDLKKFLKNISVIQENQLCIDIFKTGELDGGFCIIALFRNSSPNSINIKSIPLTITNDIDLMIYKGVFKIEDSSLYIEGNKGKLVVINIPGEEFPIIEGQNLSKYKVYIK